MSSSLKSSAPPPLVLLSQLCSCSYPFHSSFFSPTSISHLFLSLVLALLIFLLLLPYCSSTLSFLLLLPTSHSLSHPPPPPFSSHSPLFRFFIFHLLKIPPPSASSSSSSTLFILLFFLTRKMALSHFRVFVVDFEFTPSFSELVHLYKHLQSCEQDI